MKIIILNCIGILLFQQGKFSEAINKHKEAVLLLKKTNNDIEISISLLNIAQIYKSQGFYFKALGKIKAAFSIIKELDDDDLFSNALAYYNQALEIFLNLSNLILVSYNSSFYHPSYCHK